MWGMTAAHAGDVVRIPLPDGNPFPISAAVVVAAGYDTIYVSGALPAMIDKDAPKGSVEAYGDMARQAESALSNIQASLGKLGLGLGLGMGDVEQPDKPARSAVEVAALVVPGALVEIEVVAARPQRATKRQGGAHKRGQ
jgi:enamine deaminase RidA (YjgF/YER057c/UK114 family)